MITISCVKSVQQPALVYAEEFLPSLMSLLALCAKGAMEAIDRFVHRVSEIDIYCLDKVGVSLMTFKVVLAPYPLV